MPSRNRSALTDHKARVAGAAVLTALLVAGPLTTSAQAAVEVPPLLTSGNFSVLAGSEVTNIGTSTIGQDLGVAPGTSLPPATGANAIVVGGTTHSADEVAAQAQVHLTAAYNNARDQTPPIAQDAELGGETKVGGIYNVPTTEDMGLTGQLILDGANDPDSIWVFQAGRALTVGSGASVVLINGADPCRVFWQVGSSATLGTSSSMVGTVMADQSITMQTGARLQGRVLARIAAVTLDRNVITAPACGAVDGTPTSSPSPSVSASASVSASPSASVSANPSANPSASPSAGPGPSAVPGSGDDTTGGSTTITNGSTETDQVERTPTGSVDTGLAGPAAEPQSLSGWATRGGIFAAAFGALALLLARARRGV